MVKTKHYCNGCYKKRVCVLCHDFIEFYGNNPAPLRKRGKCCDNCNATKVLPARLKEFGKNGGIVYTANDIGADIRHNGIPIAVRTYKFRYECDEDIERLQQKCGDEGMFQGKKVGCNEYEFNSLIRHDKLLEWFNSVPDAHIAYGTLKRIQEYTGEVIYPEN